jgi:hypothetical protein
MDRFILRLIHREGMEQTTNKQIEGMVRRLEGLTGLQYQIGHAYGNHYTLERVVNKDGGVTDIVFAIGKRAFYDAIYAACKVLEDTITYDLEDKGAPK